MKPYRFVLFMLALSLVSGCAANNGPQTQNMQQYGVPDQTTPRALTATPDLADGPEKDVREPHPMSLADLRSKYRSTFLLNGPAHKREVALTFDDAPDDNFTVKVLDMLKQEGVKATFFVVGNRIEAHPDIVKRMVDEGHAIGNHSYNHANLPKLTDEQFRWQVTRTDELIRNITGYVPVLFRPPYGNVSEEQIKWLASQRKKIVNWDVDSLDWKNLNADQVAANVLGHIHPGAIVLQHAAGGKGEDLTGTVNALPKIIRKLKADGVKLVTVPELLGLPVGVQ